MHKRSLRSVVSTVASSLLPVIKNQTLKQISFKQICHCHCQPAKEVQAGPYHQTFHASDDLKSIVLGSLGARGDYLHDSESRSWTLDQLICSTRGWANTVLSSHEEIPCSTVKPIRADSMNVNEADSIRPRKLQPGQHPLDRDSLACESLYVDVSTEEVLDSYGEAYLQVYLSIIPFFLAIHMKIK